MFVSIFVYIGIIFCLKKNENKICFFTKADNINKLEYEIRHFLAFRSFNVSSNRRRVLSTSNDANFASVRPFFFSMSRNLNSMLLSVLEYAWWPESLIGFRSGIGIFIKIIKRKVHLNHHFKRFYQFHCHYLIACFANFDGWYRLTILHIITCHN